MCASCQLRCPCTCAMLTSLMKDLEYGKDYRYAHNEEGVMPPVNAICLTSWRKSSIISPQIVAWKENSGKARLRAQDRTYSKDNNEVIYAVVAVALGGALGAMALCREPLVNPMP